MSKIFSLFLENPLIEYWKFFIEMKITWKLENRWLMMRFGEFDVVNMLHGMEIFLSFLGILERNNLMFIIVWWREIDPSISLKFPIWEACTFSMFVFQRFFKLALVGILCFSSQPLWEQQDSWLSFDWLCKEKIDK